MSWKKVDYKGSDSVDRLHRIQALCSSATKQDNHLEGILIVGGVDSYHSQASQAALKYLFLGSSGQELLGEQVISHEHEQLEDVVLLICPQRISVFYSSESDAAVKILPVISKWRHVTEYVIHDGMEPDEQEERKISAFKSMMASVKSVGVPFGIDSEGRNMQDTMVLEKWPLIQSYGLESGESFGKGFFTMNHRVVNVSSELMEAMAQLDDFSSKRIVQESQPFLAHHFDEFLLKLDHAESPEARTAKSETDLGEDLLSFYEFGTMQYSSRGLKTAANRGSRVLFGTRTSLLAQNSSSAAFLSNSGVRDGSVATHMVVQAEDPFTGVRFSRTYFMSSGKVCRRLIDEDALVPSPAKADIEGSKNSMKDTQTLIELYALLLRVFRSVIAELVHECMDTKAGSLDKCLTSARAVAVSTMMTMDKNGSSMLEASKYPAKFIDNELHLVAEIMDARGQPRDSLDQDWCLLYCSIELANVPSDSNPSVHLGSLFVGDTFLFHGRSGARDVDPQNLLPVTNPFAKFRSWVQGGQESEAIDQLMQTLRSDFMLQSRSVRLGKIVIPLDADIVPGEERGASQAALSSKAILLLESDLLPILHGSWHVFTGGFVFKAPYFSPIVVSFERSVVSVAILPSMYEELMLLRLELNEDMHSHMTPLSEVLPFSLDSRSLYVPLQSGTRFQDEAFRALEEWKSTAATLNIPIYRASDLSDQFDGDTPRNGNATNFDIPALVKSTCDFLVLKQHFVGQDARTVDAFFPQDFIPKDPGASTTLPKPNTEDLSRLCIPITVMLGIPGSGAQAMSKVICEISSSGFEWIIVEVDLRELDESKQQHMEASGYLEISDRLIGALNRIKSAAKSMNMHPRIMLSVVGYIDPITVACAIRRASHEAPLKTKLSAIIDCLSATNVYLPDALAAQAPFPKVFDQMTAGFVTHTVLTNTADVAPNIFQRLRFHMDNVNPFADVMVLSHDVFEGPLTPLLVVDRFESAYYKQYRNFHFSDWDRATTDKNPQLSFVRYAAELDPAYAPVTFRFEIVPGIDRPKFSFLIARTLTPYAAMTKSMDKIYPLDNVGSKGSKGIRIAQSMAVEKLRLDVNSSTSTYSEGAFSNGQSRSCWCVEGQVVFRDEPYSVYEYRSSGNLARLWLASEQPNKKANTVPSLEMKITGQGLNAEKLRELLLNCYAHAEASPNQVRSKVSISLEEKREIQRQHVMDPLPDGYLFDGTNYVDFFGGRYEFHPCISQFIDEYIAAANDDRKAINLKASEERASQQFFVKQLS